MSRTPSSIDLFPDPSRNGLLFDPTPFAALRLPKDTRLDNGVVYTPRPLVDLVLDEVDYVATRAIEAVTLLDPSCGDGAFLTAAAERLAARLRDTSTQPPNRPTSQLFDEVERHLRGVDIDASALEKAQKRVCEATEDSLGAKAPKDFFRASLLCADFLLDPKVTKFVTSSHATLIVGNPPYVAATRLSADYKHQLKSAFGTAKGRLDLYSLFFERALALLPQLGRLALITPDKFLKSRSASALRETLLRSGSIRKLIRFRSHRVFPGAAVVPCITMYERSTFHPGTLLLDCSGVPGPDGRLRISSRRRVRLSRQTPDGEWDLSSPQLQELVGRLQSENPSLGSLVTNISAGTATGRDSIFVLKDSSIGIEPELTRHAVRGRDLEPFRITGSGARLIVPYAFDSHGRSRLVDLNRFPQALAYLSQHREVLEARHCVRVWGRPWYSLHDPPVSDIGRATKVLVPDVARHGRFVFDSGRSWPLHTVYYFIPRDVDGEFLTALLNSPIAEALLRLRAPIVKDGFSRYRAQFLSDLPIPVPSRKARATLVRAAARGDKEAADAMAVRLFRVSDKEAAFLRRLAGKIASKPIER